MCGATPPLPQYAFMGWSSVKEAQGQRCLLICKCGEGRSFWWSRARNKLRWTQVWCLVIACGFVIENCVKVYFSDVWHLLSFISCVLSIVSAQKCVSLNFLIIVRNAFFTYSVTWCPKNLSYCWNVYVDFIQTLVQINVPAQHPVDYTTTDLSRKAYGNIRLETKSERRAKSAERSVVTRRN